MTADLCDNAPRAAGADRPTSTVTGWARPHASTTGSLQANHTARRLRKTGHHRPIPDADADAAVDVLCIGSGIASLAVAIAAADAGLSTRILDCSPTGMACIDDTARQASSWATELQHRWGVEALTKRTRWYLDAMTEDLGPPTRLRPSAPPPVAVVDNPQPAPNTRAGATTVPPFVGHHLTEWARDCLTSPYGFLCSDVNRPAMTTLRLPHRGIIEAAAIGSAPAGTLTGAALTDWLSRRADERGIQVQHGDELTRLLFTNGHMSGAAINGPSGRRTIRTRHAMVLATGAQCIGTQPPDCELPPDAILHVCLVTKIASRFGRIELLTENPNSHLLPPAKHRVRLWPPGAEQANSPRTGRRSGSRPAPALLVR
jgi:hypothetical protein